MTDLHIPRDEKLSLPTRVRMLLGLIILSWGLIYGGYRLVRWLSHG